MEAITPCQERIAGSTPLWVIPERSVLYSIPPLGHGTGLIESLRSLVCRIAAAHCISLADLWRVITARGNVRGCEERPSISLNGERSMAIAHEVSILTGNPSLEHTTFYPFAEEARVTVKVRNDRAWCPRCFSSDPIPYERLVWNIGSVTQCAVHGVPLQSRCPHCSRRQTVSRPLRDCTKCRSCGGSLAAEPRSFAVPTEFELWTAIQMPATLQHFAVHRENNDFSTENWAAAVTALGGIKPASRALKVSWNSLRAWRTGALRPSLELMLRACWATNTPIIDFCSKPFVRSEIRDVLPALPSKRKAPSPVEAGAYSVALQELCKRDPFKIPTKADLVRDVGGHLKHPYFAGNEFRRERARRSLLKRKATVWRTVCRIHRSFTVCLAGGVKPSRRNAEARGAGLRASWAKNYLKQLRSKHEAGMAISDPHQRVPVLVAEYWKHTANS
jgi:hypothetical protein